MISPSRESEKAISGYSNYLTKALKKEKIDADFFGYEAGSPLSFFKKIRELKKYDVIHIQHEYNLFGWYGLPFFFIYPVLRLFNAKMVTTMHTILSPKESFRGSKFKTFFRRILYFFQNRLIRNASDLVFVHAKFFKYILTKEYGFPEKKIIVLPQGIIEGIQKINKKTAKKELGLSGNIYLIIGNFAPSHGADIILEQAEKIGKTILVVINPKNINERNDKRLSNYVKLCMNLVKKKNLSEYVKFDIRPINDQSQRWWTYFLAADFVLQPYRGAIGSGIFTHAMATETPVIASNIKFFKEISEKYGCIKIARNSEDYPKIIHEALKSENYSKMIRECKKYAKENSWEEIAKKYKEIYSTLN